MISTSVACYVNVFFQCLQIRCVCNHRLCQDFNNSTATVCSIMLICLCGYVTSDHDKLFRRFRIKYFVCKKTLKVAVCIVLFHSILIPYFSCYTCDSRSHDIFCFATTDGHRLVTNTQCVVLKQLILSVCWVLQF